MNPRHRMPTLFGLLGALSWTASAIAASPAPPPPVWKAVAASGPVEAHRLAASPEAWTRLGRGDELAPLDLLRTGRRGRATLVHGATVLLVDPESQVSLPAPGDGSPAGKIVQKSGSVFYEVDGRTHGGLQVVTPYLVAGVKGTAFVVTVREGSASVSVEEGIVSVVSPKGLALDVHAGETALVDATASEIIRREGSRGPSDRVEAKSRDAAKIARQEGRRLDRMSSAKRDALEAALVDPTSVEEEPLLEVVRDEISPGGDSTGSVEEDLLRAIEETTKEAEKQREVEEMTVDTIRKISATADPVPQGPVPVP